MENLWANAMSGGKEVKVKIKVIFDGNSKITLVFVRMQSIGIHLFY